MLVGGASRRMGADKATLVVGDEPLAVRVARRLAPACTTTLFVGRPSLADDARFDAGPGREPGPVAFVDDDPPDGKTPLAGIAASLRASSTDLVFVAACDLPLVDPRWVAELAGRIEAHDACVPVRDGRVEPLHALWRRAAHPTVARALADGERAPKRVLGRLDVRYVGADEWTAWDPDGASMENVNTPEELEQLLGRTPDPRSPS